jgi:4-amino-4-deoxy-L-arabinose transferase-like glycosyltransferase
MSVSQDQEVRNNMPAPSTDRVSSDERNWSFLITPLTLLSIFVFGAWLRFANLGYSDFQGDEIKALAALSEGESLVDFLLRQRKGPVQWLITYAYSLFDPQFSSRLLLILPFTVASVISVIVFYFLAQMYFGGVVAAVAAFLMATNGIFVALGRIVQYQSVCMLLLLLSLFSLSLAIQKEKWRLRGLYLGAFCGGFALLAHFDAASLIFPASLLLYWWYRQHASSDSLGAMAKFHVIGAIALFMLLIASFYGPYLFALTDYQFKYWNSRMTGAPSDSVETFVFYNSRVILVFYAVLLAAALPSIKKNAAYLFLFSWLLPSFFFLEALMSSPRTHIYVYFIPLFIVVALGFESLRGVTGSRFWKARGVIATGILGAGLFGSFAVSHYLFVDHEPEYPWNDKRVLGMTMEGRPLAGIMGFPYRRNWRAISEVLRNVPDRETARFVTNEKNVIARFYLQDTMLELSRREIRAPSALYLVAIEGAQSWKRTILGRPLRYWRSRYHSVESLSHAGTGGRSEIFVLHHDDIRREFSRTR